MKNAASLRPSWRAPGQVYFPASLLSANSENPLSVILPENPNIDELAAGLQVMAALGRWTMEEVMVFPRLKTAE